MEYEYKNLLKQTKIIATIGPSCLSVDTLTEMVKNGVDIFRLNASHFSSVEDLQETAGLLKSVREKIDIPFGVFLDLQGPKIRLGKIKNNAAELVTGQTFKLTADKKLLGDEREAGVTHPKVIKDLQIGEKVYINDGMIQMVVESHTDTEATCKVLQGGLISNHKGVNLPHTTMSVSVLAEKDKVFLEHVHELNIDYIALSFVSSPEDITMTRDILKSLGHPIPIIAKIERETAVQNIIEIIQTTDIVMVARGDLGVEIGIERVPQIQKMILQEATKYIKPVIVATQMLESMTTGLTATRAEVSDVANAIYDHCDTVMLSGETAVGVDPVNAIRTMRNICIESDKQLAEIKRLKRSQAKQIFESKSMATSFCKAADQIADENLADAILTFTSSGSTPLIASKLNPSIPIIACADSEIVLNRLNFLRAVIPVLMPIPFSDIQGWSKMIEVAVELNKELGLLRKGDRVVVTAGIPIGLPGGTNSIRMITIE